MAPHSSTPAWKIPWMEEPGRLQSMGSQRVRHNWVTSLSLSCTGEGNGNTLQCSCLENPRNGGAWWAAVYGVAQSQTRLKQLSRMFFDKVQWLYWNLLLNESNRSTFVIIWVVIQTSSFLHGNKFVLERTADKVWLFRLGYLADIFPQMNNESVTSRKKELQYFLQKV